MNWELAVGQTTGLISRLPLARQVPVRAPHRAPADYKSAVQQTKSLRYEQAV